MASLHLSYFSSARDNQPKPIETTWEDLAQSLAEAREASCTPETCKRSECVDKHGPAWSPASYPETASRARGSVQTVACLVLDIDHVPTDDLLASYIDQVAYRRIVHASHSDRPGDRCVRVVVALSRPVQGAEWPTFWQHAIHQLKIPVDQATKDASRLYFLPSRPQGSTQTTYGDGTDYLYVETDGPTLDVDHVLAQAPIPHLPTSPHTSHHKTHTPATDTTREQALATLAEHWPTQGRHQASLNLAGALAHARWDQEQIAKFLADLMDLVYGPGQDPHPHKRTDQARDSALKVERGEPVSGWPSLIPHIGEQAVQHVTKALGIGGKPQWLTNVLDKYGQPQKPTQEQLRAHYKATRAKLIRQRTNVQSQLEAKVLQKVLDFDQLADANEDATNALVTTLRTLIKYAPPLATHDQLAQLLLHVFPVNVGQDPNKSWGDTLQDLTDSCANVMAEEAKQDGEFDVEVSGIRVGKPRPSTHNMDVAFKKLQVQLRFDEFADREIIQRGPLPAETVEDHHIIGLRIEIEETFDFKLSKDEFYDYVTNRARKQTFHPVRDYLDTLEWDGTPRIGNWLHTYGQAADTDYTRAIGRLVLVAAVRRVRQPGCKFDEMLILEGEQGVQKSSAIKLLCPDHQWFTDDLPLNADTKRLMESTGGKWIIEAGELKGMTKGDVAVLKGYLSRTEDKARMAYGRKERLAPRQFIVIGTTNDAHYLKDPTGLRRFWPVVIIFFDLKALRKDRDQLWAEAAHYEALGESVRLDPTYYAIAAEEQEERRVVDTIEAILEECLDGLQGRIRCLDLWGLFGKDSSEAKPDEQARVGDAMRRLGWARTRRRINGKPAYLYIKGNEEIALVVSGRKVIQAAGAPPPALPMHTQPKVN